MVIDPDLCEQKIISEVLMMNGGERVEKMVSPPIDCTAGTFNTIFFSPISMSKKCGLGEEPQGGHGTQDGQPQ